MQNSQNSGGKRSKEKEVNEKTIDVTPTVTKEEKFYWCQRKKSEFKADIDHSYEQIVFRTGDKTSFFYLQESPERSSLFAKSPDSSIAGLIRWL